MNATDRRQAKSLYGKLCGKCRPSAAPFLAQQIRRPFKKPIQREREAKEGQEQLSERERVHAIYLKVEARAGGVCECGCWTPFNPDSLAYGAEMDEWENGNGRRRQKRTTNNCWMLTKRCHYLRQRYVGGVAYWNDRFKAHCERHKIRCCYQHIEHQEVSRG